MELRSWRLFAQDIVDCAQRVRRYTDQMSFEEFIADELTYYATVRSFAIIGVAAGRIPEGLRQEIGDVAWQDLTGPQSILSGGYWMIDNRALWEIIQTEVPKLERNLLEFLDQRGFDSEAGAVSNSDR